MRSGIVAEKIGMTRFFYENGRDVPVTLLKVDKCTVLQKITKEERGYSAILLGYGDVKRQRANKSHLGFFAKKKINPTKHLKEFRVSDENFIDGAEYAGMPSSEITIAELLKQEGYYNAHIGKWHLGTLKGQNPTDQGFDDSLQLLSPLYLPENDPNVVNAYTDAAIDRMVWASSQFSVRFNGGEAYEPGGYITDYYTDEALKVIEKNKNRPFFLYLGHFAPHNPLQALKEDYDHFHHLSEKDDHRIRVILL